MEPSGSAETPEPHHVQRNQPFEAQYSDAGVDDETVAPWANDHHNTRSSSSERTVFEADSPQGSRHSNDSLNDFKFPGSIKPRATLIRRIAQGAFATLERALVFAAFGMTLSGIVVYTGGCRESYINGCLAHLVST
jgi:hypothetical protein